MTYKVSIENLHPAIKTALAIVALVTFFLVFDKKDDTKVTEVIAPIETTYCGITKRNDDQGTIKYKCDLTLDQVKNNPHSFDEYRIDEGQKCRIKFDDKGEIEEAYCTQVTSKLKELDPTKTSLFKNWQCKGIDGFGGRYTDEDSPEKISRVEFKKSGDFEITYSKKTAGTDSVWLVTDTNVKGSFNIESGGKISMYPTSVSNPIIDELDGYNLEDMPKIYLKEPIIINVEMITKKSLIAEFKYIGSVNRLYEMSCEAENTQESDDVLSITTHIVKP